MYEGGFEADRRVGEGVLFTRDGEVIKGNFRSNIMEGDSTKLAKFTAE